MPTVELTSMTNLERINRVFDEPNTVIFYIEKFGTSDEIIAEYRALSSHTDFIQRKFNEMYNNWLIYAKEDQKKRKSFFKKVTEFQKELINTTADLSLNPAFKSQSELLRIIINDAISVIEANRFSNDISIPYLNIVEPFHQVVLKESIYHPQVLNLFEKSTIIMRDYFTIRENNKIRKNKLNNSIEMINEIVSKLENIKRLNS